MRLRHALPLALAFAHAPAANACPLCGGDTGAGGLWIAGWLLLVIGWLWFRRNSRPAAMKALRPAFNAAKTSPPPGSLP